MQRKIHIRRARLYARGPSLSNDSQTSMSIEFSIAVQDGPTPHVRALFDNPTGTAAPILFAHGAGLPMTSDFMADTAAALAELGHPVLRFNYPYMQIVSDTGKKRPPDKMPVLEACHLAAAMNLRDRTDGRPQIFAGKSMGGRVGSHLAFAGIPAAGLVFFGYPLHPQGKPEKLRDEHFDEIYTPALFIQGTRDKLAALDLLRNSLEEYAGETTLKVITGANHDFGLLRAQTDTPLEVRQKLAGHASKWIGQL